MTTAARNRARSGHLRLCGRNLRAVEGPVTSFAHAGSALGKARGEGFRIGAILGSSVKMFGEVKAFFLSIGNRSLTTQLLGPNDTVGLIMK